MADKLTELLQHQDVVLTDGAIGTNLFLEGLANGASSELWNVDHPDKVRNLHRSMIDAGSEIVLTNSFGANRYRLALHGLADRVSELNEAAANLARDAAEKAGHTVVVAGSIGPTGDVLEPLGERTLEQAEEAFTEQAEALKAGGADVAWIETMYAENELGAAINAANRVGLPFIATMTFDTGGRTMMGIRPQDAPQMEVCRHHHPIGFGANCGVGPSQLLDSILGIVHGSADDAVVVAKSNCGIPSMDADMNVTYDGDADTMSNYARMARDCGARIIGGCCGTRVEHVAAMRESLDSTTKQVPPTYLEIRELLGPVHVTTGTEKAMKRARGGRRRKKS